MDFENLGDALLENMHAMKNGTPVDKLNQHRKGEIFLLHLICHCMGEEGTSPKEISEAMNTSSARTAKLLSALEKKGYIERQMDALDRRRIIVRITKEGRNKIQHIQLEMKEEVARVLEKMGEQDAQEFVRLLGDFVRYVNESTKIIGIMRM